MIKHHYLHYYKNFQTQLPNSLLNFLFVLLLVQSLRLEHFFVLDPIPEHIRLFHRLQFPVDRILLYRHIHQSN